jgi:dolichyl-phosphate-mannose--protein O-mannosyl transferase
MFSKQFLDERPQLSGFLEFWKVNSMMIYIGFILVSSFFTFFLIGRTDYDAKNNPCFPAVGSNCLLGTFNKPQSLFWDENYHIASANRYLRGEYFMEYHPPLGKLIIALGEKIFNKNANLDTSMVSGFTEKSCVDGICYAKDACPKEKKCTIEKTVGNDQDSIPYISGMDVKFKSGYVQQPGDVVAFDYTGVRFFPVLFAWLCAISLFYLIYILTKNHHIAFVFALGYVFDNAIIVHSRGAMLDGIQLFFVIASLIYVVRAFQKGLFSMANYIVLGLLVGLAFATKVNGLILAPLVGLLVIKEFLTYNEETKEYVTAILKKIGVIFSISFVFNFVVNKLFFALKTTTKTDPSILEKISLDNSSTSLMFAVFVLVSTTGIFYFGNSLINKYFDQYFTNKRKISTENWQKFLDFMLSTVGKVAAFVVSIVVVFCAVFFIHFNLAKTVIGNNNYDKFTSIETKKAIESGETGNLGNFLPQFKDNLGYIATSQKGVASWDPTKGDNEAGSLPFTWPIGNHAIRYYASAYTKNECIDKEKKNCQNIRYTSYLYLVVNFTVWLTVLLGVILALILIISRVFFGTKIGEDAEGQKSFWWIVLFTGLYVAYMISVMQIERVMYLYHYFLPLTFGLVGSAVLFDYYFKNKNKIIMTAILIIMAILIIANFIYFAPLSYNFDLTEEGFDARKWLKYWGMFYYK